MALKGTNWTIEELDLLKEIYPKLGKCDKLLEHFPGRTKEAIALKANRIGLKVINNIRQLRTHPWYVEQLLEIDSPIIPLEEYRGSTTPILHECGTCGHTWKTRPQAILRPGALCPLCSKKSQLLSIKEVDEVITKAGCIRLSPYEGSLKPLKVKHSCGHVWVTKYSHIQQGSGCPVCNKGFGYINKDQYPDNAFLYILEIILWGGEHFVKIGVTVRRDIQQRINEIVASIGSDKVLTVKPILIAQGEGAIVLQAEQDILRDKSIEKYITSISFCGSTELKRFEELPIIIDRVKKYNVEVLFRND